MSTSKGNSFPKYRSRSRGPVAVAKTSFEGIEAVLKSALHQYGIDEDIARYRFVNHWSEIVGESIAQRTRPECIRNGQLVVRVVDSTWAQELSFRREAILKRLQRFLGADETVTDVRFYVGALT